MFTCADLETLSAEVVSAWTAGLDRDWSVPAGTLSWSCARTADHAVDTVFAPAVFLHSRRQDDYPVHDSLTPGEQARPALFIGALKTATSMLVSVVEAAGPDVRAIIWRHPRPETRGPADFPPRAGLELVLHAHDVCRGLGVAFEPPDDLCDRLRRHTVDWPMWTSPGWHRPSLDGPAFADLLHSSGRERGD